MGIEITDWPLYRANMIAAWHRHLKHLDEVLAQLPDCEEKSDLEAVREGLITDIHVYTEQQRHEGH
jgi:hypothetical protein